MSSYAVKLYCFMKKLLKIHWSFLWFNNDDIPGMSYIRFFTMLNLQQLKDWTIINQLNHLLCIITCNNTCIINTCMLMTFRKSWLKISSFLWCMYKYTYEQRFVFFPHFTSNFGGTYHKRVCVIHETFW